MKKIFSIDIVFVHRAPPFSIIFTEPPLGGSVRAKITKTKQISISIHKNNITPFKIYLTTLKIKLTKKIKKLIYDIWEMK